MHKNLGQHSAPSPANDPRLLLEGEFARRCARNPRYSLRAFAQFLGVSHSLLSLVLSGKRPVSLKMLRRMAQALDMQGEDNARLQLALGNSFAARIPTPDFEQVSLDTFALIADWYHYAILSLLSLPKVKLEARYISRKLGISELQARLAIGRLKRLKLIEPCEGGAGWRQSTRPLKVENTVPHSATRQHQRQMLYKAEQSMENDPFEVRDLSSMTLAMDPIDLPYARKRIQQFRRQLVAELESRHTPRAVYHLAVQLYPVTKQEKSR